MYFPKLKGFPKTEVSSHRRCPLIGGVVKAETTVHLNRSSCDINIYIIIVQTVETHLYTHCVFGNLINMV